MSYPTYSSRSIVFGGILIVVGLALVVFAVGMDDDSRTFTLGGLVVMGGVLRLTTALSKDARHWREHPFDASDPRWRGGAGVVQLAGRPCAACGDKITVAYEAFCCEACVKPVHLGCREHHHAQLHAMDPAWPV